jgi:hypothetical protein
MDTSTLQWIASGVLLIMSYFLKRTVDSYDERFKQHELRFDSQTKELAEIRRDYLHRDDFKEFKEDLREMFNEIKTDIKEIKNKQG